MAPESRSRFTTDASASGIQSSRRRELFVVLNAFVGMESLTAMTDPESGPKGAPSDLILSSSLACSIAVSASTEMKELNLGFNSSIVFR